MNFLVLLLVAMILLWTPWRTGYPRDVLQPWVARAAGSDRAWAGVLVLLALLVPVWLLLWVLEGHAYGLFTLVLHVGVLLLSVGRHDPLAGMNADFLAAWQRHDQAAAALVAEQQLGITAEHADGLLAAVRGRMLTASLQDYFVPAFWYLLLGPLGALGYRLLELACRREGRPVARPAATLVHALEWIPARLLALSFALVGQFDTTLRTLRSLAADWELAGGELVNRCARAALVPEPDLVSDPDQQEPLSDTRQLLVRAILTWAVVIAFLSMLG